MSVQNETFKDEYGYSFQLKVFTLMLTKKQYLRQVIDMMKNEYFDSDSLQWLLTVIRKYYAEFKTSPTLESLAIIANEDIKSDVLFESVKSTLKEIYSFADADDLPFVEKYSIEFGRNQELKNALEASIDDLEHKRFDNIRARIDQANKAGADANIGHIYKDQATERNSDTARICVPTPWDVINDIMDGGSSGGDLCVIMAPPGIGKSWTLIDVGADAIRKGKKVLHYTMELSEIYVGRRYDAYFTGYSSQNLKYHQDDIDEAVKGIPGQLVIKYYPPKNASVTTLKAHIDKCMVQDFKPDLIIVDYADLLRSTINAKEVRHALENIYEELRGMSGEYGIPVWTATQAGRSSVDDEIIGGDKVAEAFSKIMVADFVMSLSRKVNDKIAGTGRFHIIKNRFGPDGMTFPAKINTANGHIQIFEQSTVEGKEVKKDIQNGNLAVRRLIKQRAKEIEEDPKTPNGSRFIGAPIPKYDGFEEKPENEK